MISGYLCCAFDLLNVGDLDLIDQARSRCDRLVVGVRSDTDVRQRIGRDPVVPQTERMELVRHVRGVDEVIAHDQLEASGRQFEIIFLVGDRPDAVPDQPADLCWITPRRSTASTEVLAALGYQVGAA